MAGIVKQYEESLPAISSFTYIVKWSNFLISLSNTSCRVPFSSMLLNTVPKKLWKAFYNFISALTQYVKRFSDKPFSKSWWLPSRKCLVWNQATFYCVYLSSLVGLFGNMFLPETLKSKLGCAFKENGERTTLQFIEKKYLIRKLFWPFWNTFSTLVVFVTVFVAKIKVLTVLDVSCFTYTKEQDKNWHTRMDIVSHYWWLKILLNRKICLSPVFKKLFFFWYEITYGMLFLLLFLAIF